MKRDVGILVGTILFVLYFLYFYLMDEEVNAGSLGTLGDFIGGNLNPILAFITTILLIETLSLQRKATKAAEDGAEEARATVRDQRLLIQTQIFESSFFNLMSLCMDEFKNAKVVTAKGEYAGSEVFVMLEKAFSERRAEGEDPAAVLEELDSDCSDVIFNIIKSYSTAFGFINDSAPEEKVEQYISLATKLMPVPIIYLICIAGAHSTWSIVKPFRDSRFFEKKGIVDLYRGYS